MSIFRRVSALLPPEEFQRVARYIVVGLASTGTYFVTYVAAILGAGSPIWLAACAGFATGTGVSYLGNALWTFGQKAQARSAVRFLTVVGTSFTVNLAVSALLEWAGVHYLIIFCVEAVALTILNYAGHTLWAFRPPHAEAELQR
ncbi:MAG: GtrA family protein [Rhodobiaceae bacterium]|nr:GtrA family protein [Rhodobiaceae bacterium]MCC0014341.1 GtrA family protein [Rhodobiaceae bacterium]MCC0050783.1 GtrA family protein [Rhodobiaceae bacterium]MCC0060573.1 GtrA family protein [Rhodobiaceae bacterium]